jgi:hypothetical protein
MADYVYKDLNPDLSVEKSFPFSGGQSEQNVMDESRWSFMASNWQSDCVIGPYVAGAQQNGAATGAADTGFPGDGTLKITVTGDQKIMVAPGTAIVRGFYYQNTDEKIIDLSTEQAGLSSGQKMVCTIGLRLDLAKNWLAIGVLLGAAGTAPQPPVIDNTPGGNWFMPLADVTLTGGTKNIGAPNDRRVYRMSNIYSVGDKSSIVDADPGSLTYEAFGKTNSDRLWFRGMNSWSLVMELGRYREMTDTQVTLIQSAGAVMPAAMRKKFDCRMRYKWISPTTVTFSIVIQNKTNTIVSTDGKGLGFQLPEGHFENMQQVFQAVLKQDKENTGDYSNWNVGAGWAYDNGSKNVYFIFPRFKSGGTAERYNGIDNDLIYNFPPNGVLSCTGVYETNYLG